LALAMATAGLASARSEGPRSLLLITLDTLRADHLGCNGSGSVRTPNLDRLAREGVNFTRARSPVPLTLPAHASILTGNYPPTHTVRSNGEYVLPAGQLSLAEVLAARGYRTAAFVASFVLDRRFGLAQGFDHYDDRVWSGVEEIEQTEAERTADEVFAAFADWLASEAGPGPRFVWIHLYDPHAPYAPPEPFRTEYAGNPYAGEVAYTDAVVGRLIDAARGSEQLGEMLIAVVGDHGEGLGEHGEQTHSLLIYNSTLHVPMMLWGPGVLPRGRRVDDLVRIIDLAPTLLDYLGLAAEHGQGVSLRYLVEDRAPQPEEEVFTAYSESLYPELALGWSPLRALEDSEYRLIQAPTPELYAMGTDPRETENLARSAAVEHEELRRQLVELVESFAEADGGDAGSVDTLDPETRARLESLGYLASSGPSRPPAGPPVDPKDKIALWNQIQLGIAQLGSGDPRAAAETFEAVLQSDPDIPLAYEYLGTCWQKLSAADQAEKVYRQAIGRGVESARLHHELGRILLQRGDRKAAERELQAALALDRHSVVAHFDLANLYRTGGQLGLAAEHFNEALRLNPSYLWAWNGLAMTLAQQGAIPEATAAFRRVVDIAPDEAPGVFNLAVHLERAGQSREALTTYRRFLELATNGELGAQRRLAEQAVERLEP
jgi:choline-sulfatase